MTRKLLAGALALATLAAGIGVFLLRGDTYSQADGGWLDARAVLAASPVRYVDAPDPSRDAVSSWREKLSTCLPEVDTQEYYSGEEIQTCLLNIFKNAAVKLETQSLAAALSELIVERPLLGLPCHAPAHLIGDTILKAAGGDIAKALSTHDNPSCEAGFIHGMIDAFAVTNPSPAEFARLVVACESQANTLMLHYCTHGVGHAAWILTLDGEKASRYCALLRTPDGRAQCGEGVMMDMFVPATDRFESRNQANAPEEMPRVCRDWANPELPGMIEGCAHGAAFVFSKHGLAQIYKWAEKLPYPYPDTLPQGFVDDVSSAALEVAGWCDRLPGIAAEGCKRDLGIAYPHVPHPLLLRKDVRTLLCSPLGETVLANCVNQVRNNV